MAHEPFPSRSQRMINKLLQTNDMEEKNKFSQNCNNTFLMMPSNKINNETEHSLQNTTSQINTALANTVVNHNFYSDQNINYGMNVAYVALDSEQTVPINQDQLLTNIHVSNNSELTVEDLRNGFNEEQEGFNENERDTDDGDYGASSSDDYIPGTDCDGSSSDSGCDGKRSTKLLNLACLSKNNYNKNQQGRVSSSLATSSNTQNNINWQEVDLPVNNMPSSSSNIPNNEDLQGATSSTHLANSSNIPSNENLQEDDTAVRENNALTFSFWDDKNITREGRKRKIRDAFVERRDERMKRKKLRNEGKSYFTRTGKLVREKALRDLPDCRAKCNKNIPKLVLEFVFREYYELGSYDKRVLYLSNFIKIGRKRVAKIDPKKKREHTNKYTIQYNSQSYDICKKCFLITFDESNRFVQTVCEKKTLFGNVIPPSEKGRSASYKKIDDRRLECAKQHILQFPAYESHYGRSKTNKKFLSSDLSLQTMYNLYKECTTDPVSKTVYTYVFKTLNLSFKQPAVDTCQKCDRLNKQIETSTSTEIKNQLKNELDHHQADAALAYDQKDHDKKYATESPDTLTLTFDLQQCLPTPNLKTGMVFYKRQLWTYNLTIHDCSSNKAYCYIWDESVSGRGANQIASCVYDFIKNQVPMQWPNVTKFIFYSDTCAGQNKNSIMATMMLLAVKDLPYIHSIEHKFLVPGHTRMEVDSDHSSIERVKKRTTMNIHHPRDWAQLIRTVGKPGKFTVIEMTESNFYDFNDFAKQLLTIKKTNDANEKFVWADVKVLKFNKNWFPLLKYKTALQGVDFKGVSFGKRGKHYGSNIIQNLKPINVPSFISIEKKTDLLTLLPFVDTRFHDFYNNLKTKADIRNIDPDLDSSDED